MAWVVDGDKEADDNGVTEGWIWTIDNSEANDGNGVTDKWWKGWKVDGDKDSNDDGVTEGWKLWTVVKKVMIVMVEL